MTPSRFARILATGLAASSLLVACGGVSMRSDDEDKRAKTFTAARDKASIYVVRADKIRNTPLRLTLDGKISAQTGPCTYLLWEVDAGAHEIYSYADNVSHLALKAEAGKTYFVTQNVTAGLYLPRAQLALAEEATGKQAVADCRLAESGMPRK